MSFPSTAIYVLCIRKLLLLILAFVFVIHYYNVEYNHIQ